MRATRSPCCMPVGSYCIAVGALRTVGVPDASRASPLPDRMQAGSIGAYRLERRQRCYDM